MFENGVCNIDKRYNMLDELVRDAADIRRLTDICKKHDLAKCYACRHVSTQAALVLRQR